MILLKKAMRSILSNFKAYFACAILISVGVFILVSMGVSSGSLESAKDTFYEQYDLADVFIDVSNIPKSNVVNLEKLDGLKGFLGRNIHDTRVTGLGREEIITLRLISYNEKDTPLNMYHMIDGTEFYENDNIMVSQEFMKAYNLQIGDGVKVILNNEEEEFTISGAISSPEYVYAIKDNSMVVPDEALFSYAFMQEDRLEKFAKTKGTYNNVSLVIDDNIEYEDIKANVEEALGKSNIIYSVEQKNQISAKLLDDQIKGNQALIASIPTIFILMSIIILYLMLTRIIEQERGQIGTMKAFGYSNRSVMFHYISYGIITGLIGGIFGCIIGYFGAELFTGIFSEYYRVPNMVPSGHMPYFIIGIIISLAGGFAGAFFGARNVLSLDPADAMRAKAPKPIKHDIISHLPFLKRILTSRGSMAIRNIARNKVRSGFIALGIMFAFSVIALMTSFILMFDSILSEQFEQSQVYNTKVVFKKPIDYDSAVESIYNLGTVDLIEYLFEIPAKIKFKNMEEDIIITGIQEDSDLLKIIDNDKKTLHEPPKEGILLTNAIAKILKVEKGDVVYISTQYEKDDISLVVSEVITQNLGSACYVDREFLAKVLNTRKMATSVIFDTDDFAYIQSEIYEGDNIASIDQTAEIHRKYYELMSTYNVMIYAFTFLASCVAFAIIYNTSIISLSERTREYTTLRVLGLYVEEVSEIMRFEYQILSVLGMGGGLFFTYWLKSWISGMIDVDLFTIPAKIEFICYVMGMLGCILSVNISNRVAERNIRGFDMVEVLKERE